MPTPDTPQIREFIRYRAPTMSMVPVEDIPLPPPMRRTYNPDSKKIPMNSPYEFNSLLAQWSLSSPVSDHHHQDLSISEEPALAMDSVVEETLSDQTPSSPSVPLNELASSDPDNADIPKKLLHNVASPNAVDRTNPVPDKLIVYGPTATTLNTSLGIPVNGLAKNPSLLRHYSYKHRPKTGPRPPTRNDSIAANKKNPQLPTKPNPNGTDADVSSYTKYQGRRSKTSISCTRPVHKALARKATLQAIRNEVPENELVQPAIIKRPLLRARAYTVDSGHPAASLSMNRLKKSLSFSEAAGKAKENGSAIENDLEDTKIDSLHPTSPPTTSDSNKLMRHADIRTLSFTDDQPPFNSSVGLKNISSSPSTSSLATASFLTMESLKPLISHSLHIKGSSLELNQTSSGSRSPRKAFGFSFGHYKSNSLTKLTPSSTPIQPSTHEKQKSVLPDIKAPTPISLQEYPQGFSANQTLPLSNRGIHSPDTDPYSQSVFNKQDQPLLSSTSVNKILDVRRKKKKHGHTASTSSNSSSGNNSSFSTASIRSMVSGIGSINGFERDRLEKFERNRGFDLAGSNYHSRNNSVGDSADSSKLPRKTSLSSNISQATSTDMETVSSAASSSETFGTASTSLVSPVSALGSSSEPHSPSIALSHFLPFTTSTRTPAQPKNSDRKSLLSFDQKNSPKSGSPNLNFSTLGSTNIPIKISSPIVSTSSVPNFSTNTSFPVSTDYDRRLRQLAATNAIDEKIIPILPTASGSTSRPPSFQLPPSPQKPSIKVITTTGKQGMSLSQDGKTETSAALLGNPLMATDKPTQNSSNISSTHLLKTQKPKSSFTRISPASSPLISTEIEDSEDEKDCDNSQFGAELESLQKLDNNSSTSSLDLPNSLANPSQQFQPYQSTESLDNFSCTRPLLMSMQIVRDSLVSMDDDTLSYLSGASGLSNGASNRNGNFSSSDRSRQNTLTKSIFDGESSEDNDVHNNQRFQQLARGLDQELDMERCDLGQREPDQRKPDQLEPVSLQAGINIKPNFVNDTRHKLPPAQFSATPTSKFAFSPSSSIDTSVPCTPVELNFSSIQSFGSATSTPPTSTSITPTGLAITTSKKPTSTAVTGATSLRSPTKRSPGLPFYKPGTPSYNQPVSLATDTATLSELSPKTNISVSLTGYQSRFIEKNLAPPILSIQAPRYINKSIIVTRNERPVNSGSMTGPHPYSHPDYNSSSPILSAGSGLFGPTISGSKLATQTDSTGTESALVGEIGHFGSELQNPTTHNSSFQNSGVHTSRNPENDQYRYSNSGQGEYVFKSGSPVLVPLSQTPKSPLTKISTSVGPHSVIPVSGSYSIGSPATSYFTGTSTSQIASGSHDSSDTAISPKTVIPHHPVFVAAQDTISQPEHPLPVSSLYSSFRNSAYLSRASALYDYELDLVEDYMSCNSPSPSLSPTLGSVSVLEQ